jgi:VWFA-related protein
MDHVMSRRLLSVGLLAVVLVAGVLAAPLSQERSVLVTALEKDDTPIRDLTAADFLIYEDGASRKVTSAALSTEPLSVLVLIDTTKSAMGTPEPTRDLRLAIQTFVKTVFAGGQPTQMALMDYAGAGTMIRGFTDKVADVEKAAGRLVPSLRSNSVLLETLIDAAKDVGKRPGPRRAIVILDRGSQETSRVEGGKIVDAVQASGASVWAVSLQQTSGVSVPARDYALESLTKATGGLRLTGVASSAMETLMKKIADALVSQYQVTYVSEGTPTSVTPAATRGATFLRAPWVK